MLRSVRRKRPPYNDAGDNSKRDNNSSSNYLSLGTAGNLCVWFRVFCGGGSVSFRRGSIVQAATVVVVVLVQCWQSERQRQSDSCHSNCLWQKPVVLAKVVITLRKKVKECKNILQSDVPILQCQGLEEGMQFAVCQTLEAHDKLINSEIDFHLPRAQ